MLRNPTETDVRELFLSSGVRFSDKGDYIQIFCPFHPNSKTPSATIYKDKWIYKCFGCDTVYSFPKLYEELKGKPWEKYGDFSMIPVVNKDSMGSENRREFKIEEGKITSVYDNVKALAYCRERNICNDFIDYFNIQATDLCQFKKLEKDDSPVIWQDRLLIPILKDNRPYSLEGRDYTRKQTPKCLYPKHCRTDICFNQDFLDKRIPLIVCEGIMDIHKIWETVTQNVTCTFGTSVTENQKDFLKDVKDLILFIDDDAAGRNSVGIYEKFMENDFRVAVVKGKDPGDATEEELSYAIENAVNWADFLVKDLELFEKPKRFSLA